MVQDLFILLSPKNIIVFVLVLTRLSGLMLTAPFFSTYPIPMQAKAGLIALVAFIMYPMVLTSSTFTMPHELLSLAILLAKELFVGALIGFCANLIFVAIQMAGHLISIQMGLAVSEVLDPVTRQQTPAIGQFYVFLAGIVFIFVNGHQWLFNSIYSSYHTIPIGLDFHLTGHMVERIIFYTSQIFVIAFGIIVPIYGVLFVADVALGFVSKMMPQMNIFMVAMPFKIYVGLVLMMFFMIATGTYLSGLVSNLLESITNIFI